MVHGYGWCQYVGLSGSGTGSGCGCGWGGRSGSWARREEHAFSNEWVEGGDAGLLRVVLLLLLL